MMGYYDFGYGMGYLGGIFMLLFWGGVIWLIVWLVNQNRHADNRHENKTPLEILKGRFAGGEITKKEYDEMKNELTK